MKLNKRTSGFTLIELLVVSYQLNLGLANLHFLQISLLWFFLLLVNILQRQVVLN